MKMFKKLLISLLTVALVVSASCVVAFAADGDGAAITDGDIDSLAKIYGGGIYCAEDFESASSILYDSDIVDEDGVISELVDIGGNTVAKLVGAASGNKDVAVTARPAGNIAGFVFEIRVAAGGGVLNLYASGETASGDVLSNTPIASLDFSADAESGDVGSVSIQNFGIYELPVMEKIPGVYLVKDAWYSIRLICKSANSPCTLELIQTTDAAGGELDEPVVYTVTSANALKTISGAKFTVAGTAIADKTLYIDDLYFYEGTSVIDLAAKEAQLGAAIVKLVEKLDTAPEDEKADVVSLLELFVNERGYDSVEYGADVKYASLKLAEYYTDKYVNVVYSYNSGDKYVERVDKLAEIVLAYGELPEIPSYTAEEDAEAYELALEIEQSRAAAVVLYNAMVRDINRVAQQSQEFIDYISDKQVRSNRYDLLKEWTEAASAYEIDPTYYANVVKADDKGGEITVLYDMTKPYEDYLHMLYKLELLGNSCESFLEYVDIMSDPETSFVEKYNAYLKAAGIRFLDTEHTYYYEGENGERVYPLRDSVVVDEITGEEIEVKGAISVYSELALWVQSVEKTCENFIAAISDAKNATNVSALNLALAKAERYDMSGGDSTKIALEMTYPGVIEAIDDYNELYDRRTNEEIIAQRFVEAVDVLRAAKDKAAIALAMQNAKAVLPEGILDGYDGYSDALAYYLEVEANSVYNESTAKTFIALVNSIATATDYAQKYDIMKAAKALIPELDESIAGVSMAKAVLIASIQSYDVDMQSATDEFDEVVAQSASIASVIVPTDVYLRVAAIIKKIFE